MSSEISIHHLKIHPLVIASASDHFTRVQVNGGNISGGNSVIGLLFGSIHDGVLSVNDATDVLIDQSNHIDEREVEKKRNLWTAVYPTYQLVGWYAFDRTVSAYHYKVHQTISKFFPQAVFLLFHTQQSTDEQSLDKIPMTAYLFETVTNQSQKAFIEKNYSIDSTDVEKIALDEIIKSIPNKEGATKLDIHTSSLITSIQLLRNKITFIADIVQKMENGVIPQNPKLMQSARKICDSLTAIQSVEFQNALTEDYDNSLLSIYLSTAVKGFQNLQEVSELAANVGESRGNKALL